MTSDHPDLRAIEQRLAQLEKQNRRLKWGIGTIVAAFLVMGQAAPPPRIIEAQKFVLKDANGNVRGWLGSAGKGSELTLGNDSAQPMMRLLVSSDASDLHFFGSHNGGMNLGVDSGDPAIALADAESNGGVGIKFTEDGPSLTVEDKTGLSTVVGATELPSSTSGQSRHLPAASVLLLDRDKKPIWRAP